MTEYRIPNDGPPPRGVLQSTCLSHSSRSLDLRQGSHQGGLVPDQVISFSGNRAIVAIAEVSVVGVTGSLVVWAWGAAMPLARKARRR